MISVCLSVCLSGHNSGTPEPICLNFWLENSREPLECSYLVFEMLSWVVRLLSEKIVIYDKERVNGGTNYDSPGPRWVPKLVLNKDLLEYTAAVPLRQYLLIFIFFIVFLLGFDASLDTRVCRWRNLFSELINSEPENINQSNYNLRRGVHRSWFVFLLSIKLATFKTLFC